MTILIDKRRLTGIRKANGISQDDLGICLETSRRTVQRYEEVNDDLRLRYEEISQIAKCLRVEPYQLFLEIPESIEYEAKLIDSGELLQSLISDIKDIRLDTIYIPKRLEDQNFFREFFKTFSVLKNYENHHNYSDLDLLDNKIACQNAINSLLRVDEDSSNENECIKFVYYNAIKLRPFPHFDPSELDIVDWKIHLIIRTVSPTSDEKIYINESTKISENDVTGNFRNIDLSDIMTVNSALSDRPKIPGVM